MSDRLITLLLIDEDTVFRLGLVTALLNQPSLQVLVQTDTFSEIEHCLKTTPPDLVVIDPLFPRGSLSGWALLAELRRTYPDQKICLLTASLEYDRLLNARSKGVEGYFAKGTAIADLISGFRRIAEGNSEWKSLRPITDTSQFSPAQQWLWRLFASGLRQIQSQLIPIQNSLAEPGLSDFERLFLQGQQRELKTAQWLVQRLMPQQFRWRYQIQPTDRPARSARVPRPEPGALTSSPESSNLSVFDGIFSQSQNLTSFPLELDALTLLKRQELLTLTWQKTQTILSELKSLNITPEQLPKNRVVILSEIWQAVTLVFLGKYIDPKADYQLDSLQSLLESYKPIIQGESLANIPAIERVLDQLLFPNQDRNASGKKQEEDTITFNFYYLDNLIIQVANGVMVFILNYFSESENTKLALYDPTLHSSREIARFRNNLAWYYQLRYYWLKPKSIFESQHSLFHFTSQGIELVQVYAPRESELAQLRGIPWLMTLLLEFRDAVSPRLQAIIYFLGNGFVFVLTQVLGRAIGLIIKGVLQGIGSTWQDARYGSKQRQEKSNY